jgi:hypothetical protein
MSAADQLSRPLRIEQDPFAAGGEGQHIGRPLQTAFREAVRHITLKTPLILVTGGTSTGKTRLVGMVGRACTEKGLVVRRVDRGDMVHTMLGQSCDVLLVDEANSIPDSILEALSRGSSGAATTVFVGLPSFVSRIIFQNVRPVMIELIPLPPSDARNYLLERATSAGMTNLFTEEALDFIVDGSQGSPRLMRSIASFAFFRAASDGGFQISLRYAKLAVGALNPTSTLNVPESIRRLASVEVKPADHRLPVERTTAALKLPERIGRLASVKHRSAEHRMAVEIPPDIRKSAESMECFAVEEPSSANKSAATIPMVAEKAAESIAPLVAVEHGGAIEALPGTQRPAECRIELATAENSAEQSAVQIRLAAQTLTEDIPAVASEEASQGDRNAAEIPWAAQEPAESISALASEEVSMDDRSAVVIPLDVHEAAVVTLRPCLEESLAAEQGEVAIPSDDGVPAESVGRYRAHAAPTEIRNGARQFAAVYRDLRRLWLRRAKMVKYSRLAPDFHPRALAIAAPAALAAAAIVTVVLLRPPGASLSSPGQQPSNTSVTLRASAAAEPAPAVPSAVEIVKAAPVPSGRENGAGAETGTPVKAKRIVLAPDEGKKDGRRPLTPEEEAAVARGIRELGVTIKAPVSVENTAPAEKDTAAGGQDDDWIASCRQRYRSFDSASGTYVGFDGYRHYCR